MTKSSQSQILLWLEKVTFIFAARFGLFSKQFSFIFRLNAAIFRPEINHFYKGLISSMKNEKLAFHHFFCPFFLESSSKFKGTAFILTLKGQPVPRN